MTGSAPDGRSGLRARVAVALGRLELQVHLVAGPTEVIALLGPNGAGKTTLLRALAGLVPLASGKVELDGEVFEDTTTGVFVAPERRPLGIVFQDGLLFPHLSALENVAFGLRCRGHRRPDAEAGARAWLERVGLADRADARPAALSGGEAQRVALARALAVEPRLLLLDEPLSALDVRGRAELRCELRRHLRGFAGPSVLVTHDPVEAMALADRLVILEAGRVVQSGSAAEVAARPRSAYVADLAGVNLLRGDADGGRVTLDDGAVLAVPDAGRGAVLVVIHPRAVALHRRQPEGSPRNVWRGQVEDLDREGARVRVRVGGPVPIVTEVTAAAVAELGLAPGTEVWVTVKATEIATYAA